MSSVAVLGASADPSKYSHQAVRAYLARGFRVYPVNPRETTLAGLPCYASLELLPEPPDLVSVYLPPPKVLELLPTIAARGCNELWLNPGTESPEVLRLANSLGLNVIQACSILSVGARPVHPKTPK